MHWPKNTVIPLFLFSGLIAFALFFHWKEAHCLYQDTVGVITRTYVDETRNRPLETEIWYPLASNTPGERDPKSLWVEYPQARNATLPEHKIPLIMVSHEYQGDRFSLSWLCQFLASKGYLVAAMDHYGNTDSYFTFQSSLRPWNRPLDISFVLTQLLQDATISPHIDENRIGFIGFSQGGLAGLWLAGASIPGKKLHKTYSSITDDVPDDFQDIVNGIDFTAADGSFYDARIKAFLLLAPGLLSNSVVDTDSLKSIKTPIHIIVPENDTSNVPEINGYLFAKHLPHSTLSTITGPANHLIFIRQQSQLGKEVEPDELLQDLPLLDRTQIHCMVAQQALAFFQKTLFSN